MKTKPAPIKIESGIPIPKGQQHGEQYELRKIMKLMKVNDSFMYPKSNSAINAARSLDIKIVTRKVSGEGYRIWRIE